MLKAITIAAGVAIACSAASAELVRVEVTGAWDFGQLRSGPLDGINSGPVSMSFDLDSTDFVDSTNFPVRGYRIITNSFNLTAGAVSVGMPDPFPAGEDPFFVVRNDDPAVDGFFLGSNVDGFPNGVTIDNAGRIDPLVKVLFQATYGGDRLDSLDIVDAVGTYTFDGLSVFNWGFSDAGIQPAGLIFDQFTISIVPAPGVTSALLPIALIATRRRR